LGWHWTHVVWLTWDYVATHSHNKRLGNANTRHWLEKAVANVD